MNTNIVTRLLPYPVPVDPLQRGTADDHRTLRLAQDIRHRRKPRPAILILQRQSSRHFLQYFPADAACLPRSRPRRYALQRPLRPRIFRSPTRPSAPCGRAGHGEDSIQVSSWAFVRTQKERRQYSNQCGNPTTGSRHPHVISQIPSGVRNRRASPTRPLPRPPPAGPYRNSR